MQADLPSAEPGREAESRFNQAIGKGRADLAGLSANEEIHLEEATGASSGAMPEQPVLVDAPTCPGRPDDPGIPTRLPPELAFLELPVCLPDLSDPHKRKQGHMRVDEAMKKDKLYSGTRQSGLQRTVGCARTLTGIIVSSYLFQALVLCVILYDFIMTLFSFTEVLPSDSAAFASANFLTLTVLTADVLGRFWFEGKPFLKGKMNIFELVLVPVTFVEILALEEGTLPLPPALLRVLRPVFRSVRLFRVLLKAASKGGQYKTYLRHTVSGERVRFVQDGFDLDLAYINSQVIAMSVPSVGREMWFRNPAPDVARFLNERHGNKYLLLNCTEEQRYSTAPFFHRYLQFPIAKDSVPALESLLHLCEILDAFLKVDEHHVLAVHSKNGQGRTSLVVVALLVYRGVYKTPAAAIAAFEHNRVHPDHRATSSAQSIDCASQERFLHYFAHICYAKAYDRPLELNRTVRLKRIQVFGIPSPHSMDICCFYHPGSRLRSKLMSEDLVGKQHHRLRVSRSQTGQFVAARQGHHPPSSKSKSGDDMAAPEQSVASKMTGLSTQSSTQSTSDRPEQDDDDGEEIAIEDTAGEASDRGVEEMGSHEEGQVRDRLKRIVEEATPDSLRSGCQPMSGTPIFTSYADAGGTKITSAFPPPSGDGFSVGVWDLENVELAGLIRIEIHRRRSWFGIDTGTDVRQNPDEKPTEASKVKPGFFGRLRKAASPSNRSPDMANQPQTEQPVAAHKKKHQFDGGLMAACWLHTSFLEHDEPERDKISVRRQVNTQVIVALDRFGLDKGADAPALRSLSGGCRLQLDFEVEERKEKQKLKDLQENNETRFKLATSTSSSETYDLGWLTWVSKKIWPSFENGFEMLIRNSLIPSLVEHLPEPLKKNTQLTEFFMGDSYPVFEHITASSRSHDGFEVQLDIVMDYSTDTNITLDLGLATFGISHLKIHGVISLKFKPILPELPVFSAMQLLFLNPPTIDLRFARTLEIANSNVIRRHIFNHINTAVYELMVLPHIININWGDTSNLSDKTVTFKTVLPCAVLRLNVLQGFNLQTDNSMFRKLPDTFTKVSLGSQVLQTHTVRQSKDPVWEEERDLLLYDERQQLQVAAYDVDLTGRSSSIGHVDHLSVSEVVCAGNDGLWVTLEPQRGPTTSKVLLQASIYELFSDPRHIENVVRRDATGPGVDSAASTQNWDRREADDRDDYIISVEEAAPEEFTEDGDNLEGGLVCGAAKPVEQPAGAVVMLACEVLGGRVRTEEATAKDMVLRLSLGKAFTEQSCVEVAQAEDPAFPMKTQRSVEKLASMGMQADKIAEALDENEIDVQRILRKMGWNLECPQQLCVLGHPTDVSTSAEIRINVLGLKKRLIARGVVPLARVWEDVHSRYSSIISCKDATGSTAVELDIELRLYALEKQKLENVQQQPA